LKKVIDEATQSTHAAELEAVHLASNPNLTDNISATLQAVMQKSRITQLRGNVK
jgi:hypothetical protein